ncbi:MAG TPA: hypothetical protein GXX28_01585 [Firmicutes bacterium]|nr:hypothetical protein [Bacillota bacterium]
MRTTVMLGLVVLLAVSPAALAFETIPADHWAATAVEDLHNEGVLIGYPDGTFRGANPATRYELAVALKRLENVVRGLAANARVAGVSEGENEDLGALRTETANIRQLVDALAEAVKQDDQREARQDKTLNDLFAAVSALEQAVKGEQTRLDELQKLVEDLKGSVAAFDEAHVKAMIQAEVAPLKTRLDRLEAENSQLKAELAQQKSDNRTLTYGVIGAAILGLYAAMK